MHRIILSSAVYQEGSVHGNELVSRSVFSKPVAHGMAADSPNTGSLKADFSRTGDPENRLLSHFPIHRMEFEQVRDAMLAASGELDFTMGGKPVELLDAGNKRRTAYALVDRQFLPGTFRTFDFANPDLHVAVRHETTVPQQALFFLNGNFAAARARALAKQLTDKPAEQRVQQLHRMLYQRPATKSEVAAALRFIKTAEGDPAPAPPSVRETQWRYGTGAYDEATKQLSPSGRSRTSRVPRGRAQPRGPAVRPDGRNLPPRVGIRATRAPRPASAAGPRRVTRRSISPAPSSTNRSKATACAASSCRAATVS